MPRLRVIQHNVLFWDSRKYDLINTYRQFDPDIILINSHGLRDEKRLKIPGFKTYQQNVSNELNDGVAIAVKSRMRHKVHDDFLSETLAVEVETPDGPLIIATSYLPPRRPYLPHPDFLRLLRRQTPVFLVGDFNARHPYLGYTNTNQVGRDIVDYLRHQTATHIGPHFPTYFDLRTASTPDIALTNRANFLHYSFTPGPLTTSDHIPVILDISTSPLLIPATRRFNYNRTDWDAFTQDDALEMSNLPDISHGTLEEIDNALETWMTTVRTTADRLIPQTCFKLRSAPRPSRATQLLRIRFQALRDRARAIGWSYDHYRQYRQVKAALLDSRQSEARTHWGRKLASLAASHRDPRKFWREIKCLSGRTSGTDTYLVDSTGDKKFTNADREQLFTSLWDQVFREDYDDDFDDNDRVLDYMADSTYRTIPYATADPTRLTGTSPLDCFISAQELTAAIKRGKPTCPGGSKINSTILSYLPDSALSRLRAIFNAALSAGYFPDSFKQAEMRMIPKAGKPPTRPESYRPISLLEVPGKLLERVVIARLRTFLETGNHLHPAQYGFRSGRGTTHAIALATETIAVHQANRHRCNLVLRDVSKAFDRVWHLGLKYKILHLGLPAPVERLLCDFLVDRTARVRVGDHLGPAFPLATGVPQGSVLSPTLYSIYTSDCPVSDAGINLLYADDVSQVVFHPGRSSGMANARTSREVARINAFEKEWRIRTNLAKFKVIPLATRTPAPLVVDGDDVEFSPRGSLLGLSVSTTGYTSHVSQRVARAKSALTRLYRFRDLTTGLKLHLIKALILPILTYPPVPLHALSKTAISKLQRVQNSALRFAFGIRWDDYVTSAALHEAASLPALNVRLHEMAARIWTQMEAEGWDQFRALQTLHEEALPREHAMFPRSLRRIQDPPPAPRYR